MLASLALFKMDISLGLLATVAVNFLEPDDSKLGQILKSMAELAFLEEHQPAAARC